MSRDWESTKTRWRLSSPDHVEWNDGVVLLFPDPWKCFCCCCGVAVVVPGPTHRRTTSGSEPGSTFRGKRAVGAGSRRTWPPRDLFPLDTSRGADVHRRRSSPNTSTFMTTQCFFWCNLVLGWFVCFGDFLSTELRTRRWQIGAPLAAVFDKWLPTWFVLWFWLKIWMIESN